MFFVCILGQDVRRKFIWEEMSYLERWWRDASETKRESFINLVRNGQLEIVGGGWVMNDEVNSFLCLSGKADKYFIRNCSIARLGRSLLSVRQSNI